MITDALISIVNGIVNTILSWLPDLAPPAIADAVDSLGPVFTHLAWANKYVPLAEAGVMLALVATVYMTLYLIRFSVWIYNHLPVIGGGS